MKNIWSPVVFLLENDKPSLEAKLSNMDVIELRKIISYHHMDPTGTFRRQDKEWCIERIMDLSDKRSRKGDVFRSL